MAAEGLPIERACPLLGVSVSDYYCWLRRPSSARSVRHAWLSEVVGQVHADSRETYGAKHIHAELALGRGIAVCRQTVETLMRRAAGRVGPSQVPQGSQHGDGVGSRRPRLHPL